MPILASCPHSNWRIEQSNQLWEGHCPDCGRDIPLNILLNQLVDEMRIFQKEVERKLEALFDVVYDRDPMEE